MRRFSLLCLIALLVLTACTAPIPSAPVDEPDLGEATADQTASAGDESADTQAAGPETTTVRVGYIPVTIYAPLYVADAKGYFAEEGLDLELMPVQGGTDNVVQLAAGNFDVAGGGIGAGMWNAADRGIEFEIVLPLHSERPPLTTPLVVSKERFDSGEITTVADLAGQTVSTNSLGSGTEYWLYRALQQGNLTFDDVEVTAVGFRDVAAALESGTLDAGMLGEPLVTLARDQGLVEVLTDDFLDDVTVTAMYFNTDWSAQNPELAQGFVTAFLRGARDLVGDSWYADENLAIIEEYTGVPADVVARANRSYHDPNGTIPVEDLVTLQEFFMQQGELNYEELIDVTDYINATYAEAAVEALGGPVTE